LIQHQSHQIVDSLFNSRSQMRGMDAHATKRIIGRAGASGGDQTAETKPLVLDKVDGDLIGRPFDTVPRQSHDQTANRVQANRSRDKTCDAQRSVNKLAAQVNSRRPVQSKALRLVEIEHRTTRVKRLQSTSII
jgi:hypothetical protein